MDLNRQIIIAGVVIIGAGAYRIIVMKQGGTLTRILVGGYLLMLVASMIDLVGGPISQLTGLLLMLALATAAFTVIPDLFGRITGNLGGGTGSPQSFPGGHHPAI